MLAIAPPGGLGPGTRRPHRRVKFKLDARVIDFCAREDRAFVTLGLDFANIEA
jgi:hypothetical protein